MNRFLIPVLLLGSLTATSAYMAQRGTEQSEARQLSQSLRRHQYYYQHSLDQHDAVINAAAAALDSGQPVETFRHEMLEVKAQFQDLRGRLERLQVSGSVRERMLEPILHQLADQAGELERLANRLSGQPDQLREQLHQHRHPANLLTPALQEIANQYGSPRPKLWRGRPLVS